MANAGYLLANSYDGASIYLHSDSSPAAAISSVSTTFVFDSLHVPNSYEYVLARYDTLGHQYITVTGADHCFDGCATCSVNFSENACTSCFPGYTLDSTNNKCKINCTSPQIYRPSLNKCALGIGDTLTCDSNCLTCNDPGPNNCLSCKPSLLLYLNSCVTTCPLGFKSSSTSPLC